MQRIGDDTPVDDEHLVPGPDEEEAWLEAENHTDETGHTTEVCETREGQWEVYCQEEDAVLVRFGSPVYWAAEDEIERVSG